VLAESVVCRQVAKMNISRHEISDEAWKRILTDVESMIEGGFTFDTGDSTQKEQEIELQNTINLFIGLFPK
jgi:hypothetical protein